MRMAALHLRIIAKLIDIIIYFMISFMLFYLMGDETYLPQIAFIALFLVGDSIRGQSIGKIVCKIRVVNIKTQKPSGFIRSVIRNSMGLLNFFIIPAAINYILYVSYYRRIGDFAAGTCVVVDPPIPVMQPFSY